MLNKQGKSQKNFLNNADKNTGCNEPEDLALLKAGERIKNSAFNSTSFEPDFKERLKTQILEKRHTKSDSMKERILVFWQKVKELFTPDFTVKRFVPALAVITLAAVVITTLNIGSPNSIISNLVNNNQTEEDLPFARFFVDTAYAHDNFEVTATESDSLGVTKNTSFVITSKEPIKDKKDLLESTRLEPKAEFTLDKVSDTKYILKLVDDLTEQNYKVVIASSFLDEAGLQVDYDYSWAFQVKDTFKVIGTLPKNQGTDVPTNSGIEVTFSSDKFTGFEDAFSISPAVDGKFERHGRTAVFVPEVMDSGTIYTVTIKPTVGVEGSDAKISKEIVFQFLTAEKSDRDDKDRFWFNVNEAEFSTVMAPVFGVYSRSDDINHELKVSLYAFNDAGYYLEAIQKRDQIPYWASSIRKNSDLDLNKLTKVSDYNIKPLSEGYGKYLILPNVLPAGNYVLMGQDNNTNERVFIQITDVAVYHIVTKNKTMFWMNDIKTKNPINRAEIKDLKTGAVVRTGADGVAVFNTPEFSEDQSETRQFLVTNQKRTTVVSVDYYGDKDLSYQDKYWLYFYTDRYLYQPNDQINFWGVMKPRDNNQPIKEAIVRLTGYGMYDYNQEAISIIEQKITIDANGIYSGALNLKNLVANSYNLEVVVDNEVVSSRYISVRDYIKPAYQIEIKPDRERIWLGDKDGYTIKTSFFDGTPVSNVELDYSYYSYNASDKTGTIKTNELGEARLEFDTTYTDQHKIEYAATAGTRLSVLSKEAEGGDLSAQAYKTAYGPAMKFKKSEIKAGANNQAVITAGVYAVDINKPENDFLGGPVKGLNAKAKITEISYVSVEIGTRYDFINKVSYKTYRYDRVEKTLADISLTSDAAGLMTGAFNTNPEKTYEVSLIAEDYNGRAFRIMDYYYAQVSTALDNEEYEYFNLKEKKAHSSGYNLNETVAFDFVKNGKIVDKKSSGKFLFFHLKSGLQDYQVLSEPSISFKFTNNDIPNIYVGAVWFDGKTFHDTGVVTVKFNTENKKLSIKVTTDKEKYQPGEEVKLNIKVTDKNSRGVAANVNLDLVDAAILAMGKVTSNPLSEIYNNVETGSISTGFTHYLPLIGNGAEMGGCFLAGTKIKMADGSEKNIEDIRVGDRVSTFDDEISLKLTSGEVTKTLVHTVAKYLVINDRLYVTPEHKIFVNGTWQMIGDAKVGDYLLDENGKSVVIISIEERNEFVRVYNFEVSPEHTYIANGIYVHNDKGEGRDYFPDIALFKNIYTNSRGEAILNFKLPDNITSWLITAQAFSNDVQVGLSETEIPVSLPVFAEVGLIDDFIAGDEPMVKIRSYGDLLKTNDDTKYFFESESLNVPYQEVFGKAFESVYFNLPALNTGDYKVRAGVVAMGLEDAVIKPVKVTDSRLEETIMNYYDLKDNPKIEGAKSGLTTLIFTDKNRGQYYNKVAGLMWACGNRVDQRLSRVLGYDLMKKYFSEPYEAKAEFEARKYQDSDGGITLLPYSSSELELSSKVAAVGQEYFDKASLASYFYRHLNDKDVNREEVIESLYGLANLNEPVLILVRDFSKVSDISNMDKLYLGLAAAKLGDKNLARELYFAVLSETGEEYEPYKRLKVSDNKDNIVKATSLGAVLGAYLTDDNADALWAYAEKNRTQDILVNLEQIMYLDNLIPQIPSGPSKFYIEKDGTKKEYTLERGRSWSSDVLSEDIPKLNIGLLAGNVQVTSRFNRSVDEIKNNSDLVTIEKKYYNSSGQETTVFKDGEIIEVQIHYVLKNDALDGAYEITDILPSGLRLMSAAFRRGYEHSCTYWRPYETADQKIYFTVYKGSKYCGHTDDITFRYRARVANLGKFKVEPAVIQATFTDEIKAFSSFGEIMLEKR